MLELEEGLVLSGRGALRRRWFFNRRCRGGLGCARGWFVGGTAGILEISKKVASLNFFQKGLKGFHIGCFVREVFAIDINRYFFVKCHQLK